MSKSSHTNCDSGQPRQSLYYILCTTYYVLFRHFFGVLLQSQQVVNRTRRGQHEVKSYTYAITKWNENGRLGDSNTVYNVKYYVIKFSSIVRTQVHIDPSITDAHLRFHVADGRHVCTTYYSAR